MSSLLFGGCDKTPETTPVIKGIIGAKVLFKPDSPDKISAIIAEWKSFGITDAFVKEDLFCDSLFQSRISQTTIHPWVIIQNFYADENQLDPKKTDSLWAKTAEGTLAQGIGNGEWLSMTCPNGGPGYSEDSNYHLDKINRIKEIIRQYKPYGISLDFIRHFVFWEDVYENTDPAALPNSCFCSRCLNLFFTKINLDYPKSLTTTKEMASYILNNHPQEWRVFKTETITEYAREIAQAIHSEDPNVKISLHGVPWKQGEFDNGLQRIAGQDFKALGEIVDLISPMCYAKMLRRDGNWIHELVADVHTVTPVPIVPALQMLAMYGTGPVTKEDFENYIDNAFKAPASGAIFWPWETITKEQKEIIQHKLGR